MITCKLTLYSECKIKPDKNFKVDDIEYYLENFCEPTVLAETYNYVKPQLKLDLNIKIDAYAELNFGYIGGDNEYLKVDYYDNGTKYATYYFFIANKTWKSNECISLSLYMDTTNSLKDSVTITEKSTIHRQHKDRFIKVNNKWRYLIDKKSEGVNPLLYRISKKKLDIDRRKWYLIYKNKDIINPTDYNQVNPVNIALASDKILRVGYYDKPITAQEAFCISKKFNTGNARILLGLWDTVNTNIIDTMECSISYKSDNTVEIDNWIIVDSGTITLMSKDDYRNDEVVKTWRISSTQGVWIFSNYQYLNVQTQNITDYPAGYNSSITLTDNETVVASLSEWDRTDSRLIKIIELPYSPISYTKTSGKYYFNDIVWYGGQILSGVKAFKNTLSFDDKSAPVLNYEATFGYYTPKAKINEPKLYHSDYYFLKLCYDSFSKVLDLEEIDFDAYYRGEPVGDYRVQLEYIVSKNVSSNFYFKYLNMPLALPLEDYENLLIVKRNNEAPIYSSQYINYIKTGYNYDVKNKELQENKAGISAMMQIIGSGAALGGALASENPIAIGIAGIAFVTSISNGITNGVAQAIQNENTIQQKLDSAKAQAVSISQIDDVDLLDEYTDGNKAYMMEYKCSDEVSDALYDLFFYCGYKCEYQGIPDETSRLYFNYVSADIDCYGTNIPDDILEDFKNRYKIGLTVLHKVYDGQYYNYDFEQQYENWEVSME